MCEARWSNPSWFYSMAVSYEVVLTPADHLAAVRTRHLLQLARQGDLPGVLTSLCGTRIDAADEQGRTALHAAASAGQTAVVQALLDRGAPIDAVSVNLCTPLMEACAAAQARVVDFLIERGAAVAAADVDGRNCVHLLAAGAAGGGASTGASGVAAGEWRVGGGVEGREAAGDEAVLDGGTGDAAGVAETLSLLLPSLTVALATARTRRGDSPLAALSAAGLTQCCQLLLDSDVMHGLQQPSGRGAGGGMSPGYFETDEMSRALIAAAAHGREDVAMLLLTRGAHPARSCGGDGTAVHAACTGGHPGVLSMLLEWLEKEVRDGPAHHAPEPGGGTGVSEGVAEAVRMTDSRWRAPLQCAAAAGSLECVRHLLRMGAPLEARDVQGETALLAAAACGAAPVARALLDAGARPTARNAKGLDALACAARGGHGALLPLLLPLCPCTIPEAIVGALGAGHGNLALELTKLCPLPCVPAAGSPPTVSEPPAGRPPSQLEPELSASALVIQLLWQRGIDAARADAAPGRDAFHDGRDASLDGRDASRDASGKGVDGRAGIGGNAAGVVHGGSCAEGAAALAAGVMLGHAGAQPDVARRLGAEGVRAGVMAGCADAAEAPATAGGGVVDVVGSWADALAGGEAAGEDSLPLADVDDIQELIRRELEADDSEDDSSGDEI